MTSRSALPLLPLPPNRSPSCCASAPPANLLCVNCKLRACCRSCTAMLATLPGSLARSERKRTLAQGDARSQRTRCRSPCLRHGVPLQASCFQNGRIHVRWSIRQPRLRQLRSSRKRRLPARFHVDAHVVGSLGPARWFKQGTKLIEATLHAHAEAHTAQARAPETLSS